MMLIHRRSLQFLTASVLMSSLLLAGRALADPPPNPNFPVYCFRITDSQGYSSAPPNDPNLFTFEFETLNWAGLPAHGLYLSLNTGTGFGGVQVGQRPFFAGGGIDPNGTPIGAGNGHPNRPGGIGPTNDWTVDPTINTATAIKYNAGTDITPINLNGGANPGNFFNYNPNNPETYDDGPNELDGFTVTIADFNPGEVLSFNWFLTGTNGNPIGTIQNGNAYGFGVINLVRTDNGAVVPGPVFQGNTGFSTNPTLFYGNSYIARDPASFAAEFGGGLTAPFLNPLDNIFNPPAVINAQITPEPGSLALLTLGVVTFGGLTWRRKRSRGVTAR